MSQPFTDYLLEMPAHRHHPLSPYSDPDSDPNWVEAAEREAEEEAAEEAFNARVAKRIRDLPPESLAALIVGEGTSRVTRTAGLRLLGKLIAGACLYNPATLNDDERVAVESVRDEVSSSLAEIDHLAQMLRDSLKGKRA